MNRRFRVECMLFLLDSSTNLVSFEVSVKCVYEPTHYSLAWACISVIFKSAKRVGKSKLCVCVFLFSRKNLQYQFFCNVCVLLVEKELRD